MFSSAKKVIAVMVVFIVAFGMTVPAGYAKGMKTAYVDLRRAFYEYKKTKVMESDLETQAETRRDERTAKVQEITKLREETELLSEDAKKGALSQINAKLSELQQFDMAAKRELLTQRNDMFRNVIEDVQKVVKEIAEKEGYDYVFDSRNIMYGKKELDLTDRVMEQLNKE